MDRILQLIFRILVPSACLALLVTGTTALAQFKVIGPPPYTPSVARQKIKALLEGIDPTNRQQTVDTLSGLLSWYRDIVDDELITAWKKDTRANLTEAMGPLADAKVASGIVQFSWREQRPTAFNPAYASMFVNLMTRFPESAQPFLDDLLGPQTPDLSPPEAEAACRILLDMPDIGTWRKSALRILPHYRRTAESLLAQDIHGDDREKSYRAQLWMSDLKMDAPGNLNEQQSPRRRLTSTRAAVNDSTPTGADRSPGPPAADSSPTRRALPAAPAATAPATYNGAQTGTLECVGGPIPQNAEYVFRNVPMVKMQLDYDTKIWDARLAAGDGQTQRVILRNKSSSPQKRCTVHWSVVP